MIRKTITILLTLALLTSCQLANPTKSYQDSDQFIGFIFDTKPITTKTIIETIDRSDIRNENVNYPSTARQINFDDYPEYMFLITRDDPHSNLSGKLYKSPELSFSETSFRESRQFNVYLTMSTNSAFRASYVGLVYQDANLNIYVEPESSAAGFGGIEGSDERLGNGYMNQARYTDKSTGNSYVDLFNVWFRFKSPIIETSITELNEDYDVIKKVPIEGVVERYTPNDDTYYIIFTQKYKDGTETNKLVYRQTKHLSDLEYLIDQENGIFRSQLLEFDFGYEAPKYDVIYPNQ